MKITLEFDGEDDAFRATCAVHGLALWSALWDIDAALRSRYKHCDDVSDAEAMFIERLRDGCSIVHQLEEM